MFKVGDKVVCPLRGCGVVETIEERTMLNESKVYCIIKILNSHTTVMIPISRIDSSRFRLVSDVTTVNHILSTLSQKYIAPSSALPSKQRFKINTVKINSGDLYDYAEVIKELAYLQTQKPLNASERDMFHTAKTFFVSEVSLSKNMPKDQVVSMLDELLA